MLKIHSRIVYTCFLMIAVSFVSCVRTKNDTLINFDMTVGDPARPITASGFSLKMQLMFRSHKVISRVVSSLNLVEELHKSEAELIDYFSRNIEVRQGDLPGSFVFKLRGVDASIGYRIGEEFISQAFDEGLLTHAHEPIAYVIR